MKAIVFLLFFSIVFNAQSQVKEGLSEYEKKMIYKATLDFDKYVKQKKTATRYQIGGFVLSGAGIASLVLTSGSIYVFNPYELPITFVSMGGLAAIIGLVMDKTANKHIGNASLNLKLISDPELLNDNKYVLPDNIE